MRVGQQFSSAWLLVLDGVLGNMAVMPQDHLAAFLSGQYKEGLVGCPHCTLSEQIPQNMFLSLLKSNFVFLFNRAVDLDPHGSEAFSLQDPDPDPGGKNLRKKMKKFNEISDN